MGWLLCGWRWAKHFIRHHIPCLAQRNMLAPLYKGESSGAEKLSEAASYKLRWSACGVHTHCPSPNWFLISAPSQILRCLQLSKILRVGPMRTNPPPGLLPYLLLLARALTLPDSRSKWPDTGRDRDWQFGPWQVTVLSFVFSPFRISAEGVDIVLDCLCGDNTGKGLSLLKPLGTYILYGECSTGAGCGQWRGALHLRFRQRPWRTKSVAILGQWGCTVCFS